MGTLADQITSIAEGSAGTLGVAARNLTTGEAVGINADEVFPSASVIKLAILADLYLQAVEGTADLQETRQLRPDDIVEGSGILKELRPGMEFTLGELAALMIVISDNTASNMLIDRLGTEAVNGRLDSFGMWQTRLGRKFYDFEARDRGLDNWACPMEFAAMLEALERRELGSPAACEGMLAVLLRQQLDGKIPRLLPPDTKVAHKTGTVTGASHDAGIIYSPRGPIVLAVMTKGMSTPEAEGAIRQVALRIYDKWVTQGG